MARVARLPREEPTLRVWFLLGWTALGILASSSLVAGPRLVVRCDTQLRVVSEPADWRDWSLAASPIVIGGRCPDDSVEATRLLDEMTGEAGARGRLWVRRDADAATFVIASPPGRDEAPREHYLLAFRPEHRAHHAFASRGALAYALFAGFSMAVLLAGLVAARLRLRQPRASLAQAFPAPASYRVPSLGGDGLDLRRPGLRDRHAAVEGAVRVIRTALLAVVGLFGLGAVVAGLALAREVVRALM